MKPGWCDALSTCGTVAEWAAVGTARLSLLISLLAVGAAVLGAWVVYLLGRETNDLTKLTRKQLERAETSEREVIMTVLGGDVHRAHTRAEELRDLLSRPGSLRRFVDGDAAFRTEIQTLFRAAAMNSANLVRSRIHILPPLLSHSVARAMGVQQSAFTLACTAQSPDMQDVVKLTLIYRDLRRSAFILAEALYFISGVSAEVSDHGWPEES